MDKQELLNTPVGELEPEQLEKGIKTVQKNLEQEASEA